MLTALFNLVWNTQKSKWTKVSAKARSIEKVLEKKGEEQP